jgi:hypothetical protein
MPTFTPAQKGVWNTASFNADTYYYDPLYASDTVAQSANIAGALGALTRGTVLFGPLSPNPITTATLLTTVPTGATARAILAQDIDTTGGQVTGLIYTQGKFLDTAMTFSSQGAAADVAELWDWGIYVMTVEQRSGILVPMMKLPTTGGPLPQNLSAKDSIQATREEVAAIQAAMAAYLPPTVPTPPTDGIKQPAWAIAQFGMSTPTQTQQVEAQTAIAADTLATQQQQQLDALTQQQNQQMSALLQQQAQQRQQLATQQQAAMAQAQQADAAAQPPQK